jgi:Family of unknown function (DUF6262)
MAGNLANLQKATAARTAAAIARAQATLDAMTSNGEPVTFRGVAARAGVSLDFLYRSTQIRFRIEQLRTTQQASPRPGPSARPSPDEPGSVVRALTAQLADLKRRHREEATQLRQALEQAHGENLLLRRRLAAGGRHEQADAGPPGGQ